MGRAATAHRRRGSLTLDPLRDLFRKPEEYRVAGAEQYWIVDRELRSLTVLSNAETGWDVTLELNDSDPVGSVVVVGYGTVRIDLHKIL
ncbi:Uma2 family endonuclease [Nocardioides luteus]|uniref:Uncharacterized protein n=1 Tax=Nocardioides luteus TaxID=1844 RepID=A0A1J4N5M0_9ACTN|nr:Uma2 family endonuclease [Nocardioides luteus]OIJ25896.1 hypothetical protein UG56_015040 [Nocardioides luteus]